MVIAVHTDGAVEFVYQDEWADLLREGDAAIERASRVEPSAQGWRAEIDRGPQLGPFALRREAIAAEVAWIEAHRLGVAPSKEAP